MKNSIIKFTYHLALKLKPFIGKYISHERRELIRNWLTAGATKGIRRNRNILTDSGKGVKTSEEQGINLVGYIKAEMGIGESCRLAARALETVDIPFGIIDFSLGSSARQNDLTWQHKIVSEPKYNVNVFHLNANQMPLCYMQLGHDFFDRAYNIGVWHWELPDFPDEWKENFNFIDEIWAPSQFIHDAIQAKTDIPVIKIPHGIQVTLKEKYERSYFGLSGKQFLFFSMYDSHSYKARKNPEAVIKAFKEAFSQNPSDVGLVIKVNNVLGSDDEISELEEVISGYDNIILIKNTLTREEVNGLLAVTDCFVSLHRSEGFGLGLAEAMYLGKPVIGTNWSANIDFMSPENSCPVKFQLVKVGQDYGPYKSDQVWAEPDIENAAYYMKRLVIDKDYYQQVAVKGRETIQNGFSPPVVGNIMRERLESLGLYRQGGKKC